MDSIKYRIRVNLTDKEIEVEGDKDFVKEEIKALLEAIKEISLKPPKSTYSEETSEIEDVKVQNIGDKPYIKDFIAQKNPSGSLQTAVTLACYLYKYEGKNTFNKDDIKKIWVASGKKPPKKIWQAVIDGKNRYQWFEEVSRGEYKISPHGIYFVENELPKKKE